MIRTVCLLALAAYVTGQYAGDPRNAAILTDSRYLNGDGKFGASYSQEDGVEFKEETDADGTRRGSYSYLDPSGQRKTVSYTAGKNGFEATGSHLPVGPHQLGVAPTPEYTPLPQYNPQPEPAQRALPQQSYSNEGQYRPQPQQSYNPAPQYRPQPQQARYNPAPQQSYNPPQQSYNPPQQSYNPPQQSYTPSPSTYRTTTQQPHRFFPPGKLSLNRSPDGYSYTFNKN